MDEELLVSIRFPYSPKLHFHVKGAEGSATEARTPVTGHPEGVEQRAGAGFS